MQLDVLRMVADWLAKGTNGSGGAVNGPGSINALLPAVPRDGGDPQPANVKVYDATRDGWVARIMAGYEGSGITFPAVAVFLGDDIDTDGEILTTVRDGTVDVCVMVVEQRSDSAPGMAAALYTVRAIERSFKQFHDQANYDAFRVRHGVALRSCQSLKLIRGGVVKGGIVLTAGVIATYHVRDEAP